MRRSDIKQIRRRLTCAALRVWESYRATERGLKVTFEEVQAIEAALAKEPEYHRQDHSEAAELYRYRHVALKNARNNATFFSELATWYKAGHEQLNAMIAIAEARAKELK